MEFGSNTFNANGSGGSGPETLDVAYSLDSVSNKNRDFHNPMYDAVQNNPDVVGNGSSGKFIPFESPSGSAKGEVIRCVTFRV